MNKWKFIIGLIGLSTIAVFSDHFFFLEGEKRNEHRVNGFNLVAPPQEFPIDSLQSVQNSGATWVSIVPYAFCDANTGEITFNHSRQWWGEKPEGVKATVLMAKSLGLKVMLKPHLWVGGQGWAGDLNFKNDSLWQYFEKQYKEYIFTYAQIAESLDVELFCIGTEIRNSTQDRSDFWLDLISETRNQFSGDLTYAANWDEYDKIEFWNKLDYIGIDAYFPLIEKEELSLPELIEAWNEPKNEIKLVSKSYQKPILFTEYGYESIDYNTMGHWKLSKDTLKANFNNQEIAFQAVYETFRNEDWWAGGFIWKWHLNKTGLHTRTIKAYTPQNKPAMEIIKAEFKKDS